MAVSYPMTQSLHMSDLWETRSLLAQSSWPFYPPLSNSPYHHGSLSKGQPYYQGQPNLQQIVNPTYSAQLGQLALNMDPPQEEPMEWKCEANAVNPFLKKAQEKDEPMEIEEASCYAAPCKPTWSSEYLDCKTAV
jgi:hypothetical protein